MPLRIGIAIVPVPSQAGAGSDLDAAVRAEADGADVVWILGGERIPDPERLQLAAQVAASTRTIRIGLGPLAWPPESWLRTAEDLATLDALSGGRIEVVLRLPGPGSAFDWAAAGEDLDLLHRAWQAGPDEHESPRHRITGVAVHPKPAQPEGPPIWLAVGDGAGVSREESAADFARRHGAGLLWD